jgi:hypothetical protein
MLEADLDPSPRTLRFFVDDREQPIFITHIPQSINFAVCMLLILFFFHFVADHVTSREMLLHSLPPRGG